MSIKGIDWMVAETKTKWDRFHLIFGIPTIRPVTTICGRNIRNLRHELVFMPAYEDALKTRVCPRCQKVYENEIKPTLELQEALT